MVFVTYLFEHISVRFMYFRAEYKPMTIDYHDIYPSNIRCL
jgi:hypothetical protein